MATGGGSLFDPGVILDPADQAKVLATRFLLASQSLAAIGRLLPSIPTGPEFGESKWFLLVLSIGAANEAAMALQDSDRAGVFADLDASGHQDAKARLARLRLDSDHTNASSLRSLLIRTTRNKLGFHWDIDVVRDSLQALAGKSVPVSQGSGTTVADNAIPIVTAIIESSLERLAGGNASLKVLLERIAAFQGDCFHVAHATFKLILLRAGVSTA